MATADLKLVYGGGGSFTPTFFSGALQLTSGATGTLLTITPPAGKKVRLTSLVMTTGGTTEASISVSSSGSPVVSGLTLVSAASGSVCSFVVGQTVNGVSGNNIDYVDSISSITISKSSGSTTNPITYSYAYGD